MRGKTQMKDGFYLLLSLRPVPPRLRRDARRAVWDRPVLGPLTRISGGFKPSLSRPADPLCPETDILDRARLHVLCRI